MKSVENDPFNLNRFIEAQAKTYVIALNELKSGKKRSHWMWYIFPQIDGLGFSPTTQYYAIKSLEEARQYLAHPILGARLLECSEAVYAIQGREVSEIFGYPDDLKFCSCMTLFSSVSDHYPIFNLNLEKYFHGKRDARTLEILAQLR